MQVCISLSVTLPELSEESDFFFFKFAVKWCPTHAAWLIIDFTQLMGGMIRSEYLGDLFNSKLEVREGIKVVALIRHEVLRIAIYGIQGDKVG